MQLLWNDDAPKCDHHNTTPVELQQIIQFKTTMSHFIPFANYDKAPLAQKNNLCDNSNTSPDNFPFVLETWGKVFWKKNQTIVHCWSILLFQKNVCSSVPSVFVWHFPSNSNSHTLCKKLCAPQQTFCNFSKCTFFFLCGASPAITSQIHGVSGCHIANWFFVWLALECLSQIRKFMVSHCNLQPFKLCLFLSFLSVMWMALLPLQVSQIPCKNEFFHSSFIHSQNCFIFSMVRLSTVEMLLELTQQF